jgi:hypothetical protein
MLVLLNHYLIEFVPLNYEDIYLETNDPETHDLSVFNKI